MTRQQIVEFTAETDRRIAENEVSVVPLNDKHRRRLAELKAEADRLRACSEGVLLGRFKSAAG
jgi:hypothetical protein